jgi:hypothetical protein
MVVGGEPHGPGEDHGAQIGPIAYEQVREKGGEFEGVCPVRYDDTAGAIMKGADDFPGDTHHVGGSQS